MKINKNILESRLQNKFRNLALHAIVNETFLNSIIFHEELSNKEIGELSLYSKKVFESMGGFSILESAIVNETNKDKLKLLSNMYNICTEAADKAAKEYEIKDPDKTLPEIIDDASFTKEEMTKFSKDAESVDTEYISEIIKEKVIQVIKDEKEELERSEEIETELEEMLSDETSDEENVEGGDIEKESSLESFYNIALDKSYVRKPISIFSKIIDITMENLMNVKLSEERLDMNLIEKITLEKTFPIFDYQQDVLSDIEAICESLIPRDENRDLGDVLESISEPATISSIVVYTLLESFNTLNLINIDKDMVKEFLNKPISFDNEMKVSIESSVALIKKSLRKIDASDMDTQRTEVILQAIESMGRYVEILGKSISSHVENKEVIENLIEDINRKKNLLVLKVKDMKNKNSSQSVVLNTFEQAQKDLFRIELDKVSRNLVTKAFANEVRILHDPELTSPEFINIEIRGENGIESTITTVPLYYKDKFGNLLEFITESVNKSKLSENKDIRTNLYNIKSGERTELI